MSGIRTERDALGEMDIPAASLWGVHTERARINFRFSDRRVPFALIAALATVKKAAARANAELGYLPEDIACVIAAACDEICNGSDEVRAAFPLDALQGGAGTSTNMNVNEVVANLALRRMGKAPGDYGAVHPLHHVNLHQSTNDVYPTALRVAAIGGLRRLSESLAALQGAFQAKEGEFSAILKMGRTELQTAVPMTLGQEFSAFAETFARDRWRTFKCEERLRQVNLGGTAIGTGITAPTRYIFRVIEVLREMTGMGLSRAENVIDATANADGYVEVSGILKAVAVNFSKVAGDLRQLHFLHEISLPAKQAGSSIMPGKVNPVLAEAAMEVALAVRADDFLISECAAHGTLQINEFMPQIAYALLEAIDLLDKLAQSWTAHVAAITADAGRCALHLYDSPTLMTAFIPHLDYATASALSKEFAALRATGSRMDIRDFLRGKLSGEMVDKLLAPSYLTGFGYKD